MTDILQVYMDGARCGEVRQTTRGDLRFVYDEEYRNTRDATPLSLSMPLAISEHRKRVIAPFLDGLITDNETARQSLARRFGVSPNNGFAILSHIGADVAGALQLLPEGVASTDALPRGVYHELADQQVGEMLRGIVDEYRDGRAATANVGQFSLAGAQPKIALLRTSDGDWATTDGGTPTTHILKPVAGDYRRIDIVEHMTMRAAEMMGLSVASTSLDSFDGVRTFVATRYDREYVDGLWRRLHQEDLGQSLAVPPAKKYQRLDGGPGVADVARLFRGLSRPRDRSSAAWAFYQGLMFNTVLECTDAHIKNYAVMLSGNAVTLAPLYDLATFAPYRTANGPTRSAMKIGGEYRFAAIGQKHCLAAAAALRVGADRALDFVNTLRNNVTGAFEAARDELADTDRDTSRFAGEVLASVAALPLVR